MAAYIATVGVIMLLLALGSIYRWPNAVGYTMLVGAIVICLWMMCLLVWMLIYNIAVLMGATP